MSSSGQHGEAAPQHMGAADDPYTFDTFDADDHGREVAGIPENRTAAKRVAVGARAGLKRHFGGEGGAGVYCCRLPLLTLSE